MTNAEALELFNYMNNDAQLWSWVEVHFRNAERSHNRNEYVPVYLEADLITVVSTAARRYTREYVGRTSDWREMFTFPNRQETAKLLAEYFEREIELGNGWLGND